MFQCSNASKWSNWLFVKQRHQFNHFEAYLTSTQIVVTTIGSTPAVLFPETILCEYSVQIFLRRWKPCHESAWASLRTAASVVLGHFEPKFSRFKRGTTPWPRHCLARTKAGGKPWYTKTKTPFQATKRAQDEWHRRTQQPGKLDEQDKCSKTVWHTFLSWLSVRLERVALAMWHDPLSSDSFILLSTELSTAEDTFYWFCFMSCTKQLCECWDGSLVPLIIDEPYQVRPNSFFGGS